MRPLNWRFSEPGKSNGQTVRAIVKMECMARELRGEIACMSTTALKAQELQRLLGALGAGADQPLFALADWQARLNGVSASPTGSAFMAALSREWLPAVPPDTACESIMEASRAHVALWHDGWPHLWAHTLRVTGTALALASEAGIDPANAFVLGVLHDVGKLDEQRTGVQHELIGALMAHKLLGALPDHFPSPRIERLANVITKRGTDTDPLRNVLYDADKLDKIGATGILRRISTRQEPAHVALALQIVAMDLGDFPPMHFRVSQRLADQKRTFTQDVLAGARPEADDRVGWNTDHG